METQTPQQKQQATAMAPIMIGLFLSTCGMAIDSPTLARTCQILGAVLCIVGVYVLSKSMRKTKP